MATLQCLPKPTLRRSCATAPIARASFFDEMEDARSSPEACRLRTQILTAYANCGFRGRPFVLPGGAVVSEDMWESALEVALDETVDQGLDALREFSLERWLGMKVRDDGDAQQQAQYKEMIASFDMPPEPVDDSFRVGLPNDIYTDVVHQPLQEIEVYRGLDDLVVPEAGDDDDDARQPRDDADEPADP